MQSVSRPGGLFTPPGVAARVAPFAAAALAGAATLVIPGEQSEPWLWLAGLAVLGTAVAATVIVPWSRLPAMLEIAPVLMFLVSLALLRHSEGGAASGFAPLVVLPIVFVALYGTSKQAFATLIAGALMFAVPALVLDEVRYPPTEWRRTIIWLITGATTSRAIQGLVREISRRSDALAALGTASRALLQSEEPRAEVCRAACRAAGGDFAVLMAARGDALVPIAAAGMPLPDDIRVPPDHPVSGTARAFASRSTVFAPDARSQLVSDDFVRRTGVASAIFEPVLVGEEAIAVLLVGYATPVAALPDDVRTALAILAADAAQAMEREQLLATLRDAATHDPLTGAANRRLLEEFLEREFARGSRTGQPLSIAMIDVDHFKAYNDRHGHVAGDGLLASAAVAWKAQLRLVDLLARYGGEEFVAVLVGADPDTAAAIAERMRAVTPAPATCSIGVATWDGVEPRDELVAGADAALYRAKSHGRNRVVAR